MVRTYIRKTNKENNDNQKASILQMLKYKIPLTVITMNTNLSYGSIKRYNKLFKRNEDFQERYLHRSVFSPIQEAKLTDYLIKGSRLFSGLCPNQVRVLAYQMAKRYSLQVPKSWEITQSAGEDWVGAFIKRNQTISLRTPEATSIARATNFNMKMVDLFFNNYLTVTRENNFLPCDIYNMDETGLTTVQRPNKVIARKGEKQVVAITTSECGTLMTLAIAVNALGNSIPLMFIYPRKKFYDHYLRDGPVGCIGVSNGSGWMLAEDFIYF
ncbi:uncharacterized protein LOC135922058 [Gordionus sp. m RMFG-2023]|uniref:uncharacterized protein LOC135922058 n=1 Tax=Gordionus sp. m RMFG-2023 TaxID=3053472 RepID=UPI0031FDD94C